MILPDELNEYSQLSSFHGSKNLGMKTKAVFVPGGVGVLDNFKWRSVEVDLMSWILMRNL